MNLLHLKYAVEVAKTQSISKAAENLYMNQPNLSRAIKELEESTGFAIFKRTSKGMILTEQGEEYIVRAKKLLEQIDSFEAQFSADSTPNQRFSVSVPRVSYIAYAFQQFAKQLDKNISIEIHYKETNSVKTVSNVLQDDYNLGIVRYRNIYDEHFKEFFKNKGLEAEFIVESEPVLVLSADNPLAKKEFITSSDLTDMIEITDADVFAPSIPMADVRKSENFENVSKRIYVYERCSRLELLSSVPETFMHVSPLPSEVLDKYNLVEKKCIDFNRVYRDVLIYNKGYRFSSLDNLFIAELFAAKMKFL